MSSGDSGLSGFFGKIAAAVLLIAESASASEAQPIINL